MEKLYPIGTIVRLKKGQVDIMITGVCPLYNDNGTIGYYDYSACLYPHGQTDQNSLFFNEEDIDEVLFTGYEDEHFEKYKEMVMSKLGDIKYPHLKLH
ncbi:MULTISPECIES: DUF4176 domain-containing protein [unclassified Butyrivibrio]|uniref:DUF4176 domain-containing protein n=1 Tax=unclassified Butyrivibrio TaxID=2639466 RepID=UPI0003B74FF9|nr:MULTISPECIES: DUF4176 domain-containing protein [unclassified Butyrivibrio]MDC7292704.1 DUF4176 domain-containing protein [Butyrivibrio sp. DSM 10294]